MARKLCVKFASFLKRSQKIIFCMSNAFSVYIWSLESPVEQHTSRRHYVRRLAQHHHIYLIKQSSRKYFVRQNLCLQFTLSWRQCILFKAIGFAWTKWILTGVYLVLLFEEEKIASVVFLLFFQGSTSSFCFLWPVSNLSIFMES